ncbi:hypothetical protein PG984_012969 [Apiospora sp. TS-2023a]
MPGKGLLDLPLECFRAILNEAVAGQCPWSISEIEDNEDVASDCVEDRGSTADIRVLLQWRRVNHLFNQEILLCIEDAELLSPRKWHDINIYEVIRQECQQTDRNLQQQRHEYLKVLYKDFLEGANIDRSCIMRFLNYNHELLPGVHPGDSRRGYLNLMPQVDIMICQILLNQLEPIRRYIRSKDSHHFRFSDGQDMRLGRLLLATAKTGHRDLAEEILDLGAYDNLKHFALMEAFEREDISMVKLLLVPRYRHTLEGSRRMFIKSLIIRSTQLDLRSMTNTLLDHAEYMRVGSLQQLLTIACYNGDDDLVRRLFAIHRHLDVFKRSPGDDQFPKLSLVPDFTPLAIAANSGHESTFRLLLEKAADPLFHAFRVMKSAACGGHIGIARIHLEFGVYLAPIQWARVIKAYAMARRFGSQNVGFISFLLDENLVNISKGLTQYPQALYKMVYWLCLAGDVAAIRLFAAHGMPMFGDFYTGLSALAPINIAAVRSSPELREVLKELGAPEPRNRAAGFDNEQSTIRYHSRGPMPQEISFRCSTASCKAHAANRWHEYALR